MEYKSTIAGQFFCTKTSTVDLHILVVDDDATSLAIVSAMLRTLKYAAVTVRNATDALATLRVKKFDLVVTDLHMPEMNGLELQKRVKEEFKLPVIMMSADDEKSVIIKSLHRGADFYMVKPISLDDLRHVWQYAILAKKDKSVVIEEIISIRGKSSNRKVSYEDINSASSSSSVNEEKRGKMDSKRKAPKMVYEDGDQDSSAAPKKAKVVWTTLLHNRFLQAIRHLTLEKAVPKRILEFMNVPGLTRENVASHLQKYRIFLKRVADKGALTSRGFYDRSLRSSFAAGFPSIVMRNAQAEYPRLPEQQQTRTSMFQPGLGVATWALNTPIVGPRPFPPKAASSVRSLPQSGYGQLFSAPNKEASSCTLPQLGNERWYSLRSQANLQQPLFNNRSLLHRANRLASSTTEPNNLGSSFPSQGDMPNGTRNAANGLMKGINSVQVYPQKAQRKPELLSTSLSNHNFGTIGVRNPDYVLCTENMGSLYSCNPAANTRCTNGKYAGIEMNSGGKLVVNGHTGFSGGVENDLNNGHGLMNGHNSNMTVAPLGNLTSGYMAQGGSSSAGFESANQWAPVLNSVNQQENAVLIQPGLQQQYGVANGGENDCDSDYLLNNLPSTNDIPRVQQLGEDDLIDLFLEQNRNPALDHRVPEVNPLVNELRDSELYGSSCFENNAPLGEPSFAKHENGRRLVDSDELYGMYQVENTPPETHPFISQGWEEEFMDSSIFGHNPHLREREAGEDLNPAGENLFYLS